MKKLAKAKIDKAWDIAILVPESRGLVRAPSDASVQTHDDPSVETHSYKSFGSIFGTEKPLDPDAMRADWESKLAGVVDMASSAAAKRKGWQIEEIEIGFTLSAEGKLLFIAKAGIAASVKVVMKKI